MYVKESLNREVNLRPKRTHQDLVIEHGFAGKDWSVYCFVSKLGGNADLPFRRMEVNPGAEPQVDFGKGAAMRSKQATETLRRLDLGINLRWAIARHVSLLSKP